MSRLDEVRALIATEETDNVPIETYHSKLRTLAAEVDELRGKLADWEVAAQQGHPSPCTLGTLCPYCEIDRLRGKLDDVRMGIGCARGQRTTQYCAEAAQRDDVITELLAMLKDNEPGRIHGVMYYTDAQNKQAELYNRACEIAGRTE